jgi:lysophospholipase L1-like esterase
VSAGLHVDNPRGVSTVVTITYVGGGTVTVYSDADCTSSAPIPATVTADADFFVKQPGPYEVTVVAGGVTLLNAASEYLQTTTPGQSTAAFSVHVDEAALEQITAHPTGTLLADLTDRTNETSETVPAGSTTNSSTAGITKTAPALLNPVGAVPQRFAVKNNSTGTITVAYPDYLGNAQSLTILAGEAHTFRQKTVLGWGSESNKPLSALDGRFAPRAAGGYAGNIVASLGDSMTSANGAGSAYTAVDQHTDYACIFSGQRLRFGQAAAAGGFTTAQIRDQLLPNLLLLSPLPNACVVLAGRNDVGAGSSGSGYNGATAIAALEDIYMTLLTNGIRPVAATIPPAGDNSTVNNNVDNWNIRVRKLALKYALDLLDYHKVLTSLSGNGYVSGYNLADLIHPSYLGHKVMGQYAAGVLAPRFPEHRPFLAQRAGDSTDLLGGKGCFLVDTNADGISDGWSSFSGTGQTFSRRTDADGVTVWQRITMPTAGTGSALLQAAFSGVLNVGDVIEVAARVITNGFDAVVTPTSSLTWGITTVFTSAAGFPAQPAYNVHCDVAADGSSLVYARAVVGAGASGQLKVNMTISGQPSTGSVYLEVANYVVRNLTVLGLA